MAMLPQENRRDFAKHGWTLVPGFVDDDLLDKALEVVRRLYPTLDEYESNFDTYDWIRSGQFGGINLWPVDDVDLNLLPLHPTFVAAAEELVGSSDIRLVRAGYQMKVVGAADYRQPLHYDYPTHSLVVPDDDEVVGFFVYLTDVTPDLGPTTIVSDAARGELTPDATQVTPDQAAGLATTEVAAPGPAGSLLAYRSTTLHRGSAMTAERGERMTLAFAYARPRPWTGFQCWPRWAERPGLMGFIAAATPRQRELIGFPPIGDPYWTERTIALVERRYPGLDLSPYQAPA